MAARHPDWVLGYGDETWWTRVSQPALHTWTDQPLRLVAQSVAQDDPDPKALGYHGLLGRFAHDQPEEVWLRFCAGRPVSALTILFLADCCDRLAARGKRVLALIWDNASWHISKAVRGWIREHNRQVKQEGRGVRILVCQLPVKAPWLNPIDFELSRDDVAAIATLDTKTSSFFDHRDPAAVKRLGEAKLPT